MAQEIVSIEEIVRRKYYKNSIDRMNVDIKSLINPDAPRFTNLLYAPTSHRLISKLEFTKEPRPLPRTIYLREEALHPLRTEHSSRRSKQHLIRTEAKPTPQTSFQQTKEGKESQHQRAPPIRKSLGRDEPENATSKLTSKEMKMNKTLNAFLFKMELPENPRVNSCQAKKRVRYYRESENNSVELKVDTSPGKDKELKGDEKLVPIDPHEKRQLGTLSIEKQIAGGESLGASRQHPPPLKQSKRSEKIPEFIKINLQIDEPKRKEPPIAALMFAERRVKSVIKLRRRKDEQSGSKEPEKQKPQHTNKLREAIAEEYKRFATIQPEVSELKILSKLQRKLYKCEKSSSDLRRPNYSRESRRKKRRLLTEKPYQGDICGWNNQENEDHLNIF